MKLIPGWRLFQCENNHEWKERCRDFGSFSNSVCPECNEVESPIGAIPMPDWEVDSSGNLKGYYDS